MLLYPSKYNWRLDPRVLVRVDGAFQQWHAESAEQYLCLMSLPGSWLCDLELRAYADACDTHIEIYEPSESSLVPSQEFGPPSESQPIRLMLYVNHFTELVPRQVSNC
jgi:hypothetical protein